MTDFKAQSKTIPNVVLGLYGYHLLPSGEPSACEYTTAYVQLSRCTSIKGMRLLREVRPVDYVGLRIDERKLAAIRRLENLSQRTIAEWERREEESDGHQDKPK
jgi:hypothetical protein